MGNDEVIQIRTKVHRTVLRWRAFQRIVDSQRFEDAYKKCDKLDEILKSGNPRELRIWIEKNIPLNLGTMSYRQLRDLAKENNVYKWSRLDTLELIEALEQIPSVKERFG